MEVLCESALAVLIKGWSPKIVNAAAESTQESPQNVEAKIRKIIQVFDAAVGAKISDSNFQSFKEICALNNVDMEDVITMFESYK